MIESFDDDIGRVRGCGKEAGDGGDQHAQKIPHDGSCRG